MKSLLVPGLLILLVTGSAAAAELVLDETEIDNLGVAFAAAESVDAVAVVQARAEVVVPPSDDYVIASAVPGLVERVYARVGGEVTVGEPLLEIRSADFLTLQQQYLEAVYAATLADAQLARDEQLAAEGIIAARRLEETRAHTLSAAGRLIEHEQLLRLAGMRDQDIDRLADSKVFLQTMVVRSPIDGVVLETMTRAGQSVDSVAALCRVANLSTLWLDIRVPREQVARVAPGATVTVNGGASGRPARVNAIGRAVDPATQTVSVRAELTGSDHGLRPGEIVGVSILADEASLAGNAERAVTIPIAALIRSGDDAYVFVRSARGVTALPVNVVASANRRAIVRGIEPDASVAVAGISALKALWLASAGTEG